MLGVRGDADLRVGKDVIVAPDDAVIRHQPRREHAAPRQARGGLRRTQATSLL